MIQFIINENQLKKLLDDSDGVPKMYKQAFNYVAKRLKMKFPYITDIKIVDYGEKTGTLITVNIIFNLVDFYVYTKTTPFIGFLDNEESITYLKEERPYLFGFIDSQYANRLTNFGSSHNNSIEDMIRKILIEIPEKFRPKNFYNWTDDDFKTLAKTGLLTVNEYKRWANQNDIPDIMVLGWTPVVNREKLINL